MWLERLLFVVTALDGQRRRLGNLQPGSGEVAGRLGDDDAILVGELLQARVIGMKLAQGVGVLGHEQGGWTTIALSHLNSSTRRTTVRAAVLNPVGR
jgi:hypothetical protein